MPSSPVIVCWWPPRGNWLTAIIRTLDGSTLAWSRRVPLMKHPQSIFVQTLAFWQPLLPYQIHPIEMFVLQFLREREKKDQNWFFSPLHPNSSLHSSKVRGLLCDHQGLALIYWHLMSPWKNKRICFRFPVGTCSGLSPPPSEPPWCQASVSGQEGAVFSCTWMGETAAAGAVLVGMPLRGLRETLWTGTLCPVVPVRENRSSVYVQCAHMVRR